MINIARRKFCHSHVPCRATGLARQEGVRVPLSMPLSDEEMLDRWVEASATPFVLKADGSWAGFGVRIISDAAAAKDAYWRMTQPVTGRPVGTTKFSKITDVTEPTGTLCGLAAPSANRLAMNGVRFSSK
jgi:hypothetical protein